MFQDAYGPWPKIAKGPQYDFHRSGQNDGRSYDDHMHDVYEETLNTLKRACEHGLDFITFIHGNSTSGIGKRTSRSVIRELMRSKEATPYIVRKECIQHETIFVACLKPNKAAKENRLNQKKRVLNRVRDFIEAEQLPIIRRLNGLATSPKWADSFWPTFEKMKSSLEPTEVMSKLGVRITNAFDSLKRKLPPFAGCEIPQTEITEIEKMIENARFHE